MRKVILFIAMSLDGYIAGPDGGVDWLSATDNNPDDGYDHFIEGVDTVIMGWTTYHQIITELSPEKWVYDGLQSYVLTHRTCPPVPDIRFVNSDPRTLIGRLKQQEGKNIWLCGGADLVGQFMREDLIDRYHLSILPILLGRGIPLFSTLERDQKLCLLEANHKRGMVELIYERV